MPHDDLESPAAPAAPGGPMPDRETGTEALREAYLAGASDERGEQIDSVDDPSFVKAVRYGVEAAAGGRMARDEGTPEKREAWKRIELAARPAPVPRETAGAAALPDSLRGDSLLIDLVAAHHVVVRPMTGGGFAFENEDGELWDGVRYPTWRDAAFASLAYFAPEAFNAVRRQAILAASSSPAVPAASAAGEGVTDTERLDWLEAHANPAHKATPRYDAKVRDIETGDTFEGRTLRQAIDAALVSARQAAPATERAG